MLVSTEARKCTIFLTRTTCSVTDVLHRFSSFDKILRIVSYIYRFADFRLSTATTAILSADEVVRALHGLIRCVQQEIFLDDFIRLKKSDRCLKPLRHFDPFIDETGRFSE